MGEEFDQRTTLQAELKLLASLLRIAEDRREHIFATAVNQVIDDRLDRLAALVVDPSEAG